jgi:ABC-2 type transport system permease protein
MEVKMERAFLNYLKLCIAYVRLNFNAHLEYRGAFISQVLAMLLNNCMWLAFWGIFFTRFPVLRGWTIQDVITMWAITASGFGLAHTLYGNAIPLASLITMGQLDVWMLYPRRLLPHLLLGKMNATSWGDTLFGYGIYVGLVHPDGAHFALFVLLSFSVAALFVGFSVLTGSLSFFVGNASMLSDQWRGAMMTFSTYPATLFEGTVKFLLFTLLPAGFVSYLPIEALRSFSLVHAALTLVGSLVILGLGVIVFYVGLQRYESGNLMEMRG